jgi:prepilin-type N-terminal cleavage/methylation domain-containing protein/prepilin-type processing-associated H-X9-DG protein
LYLELPIGKMVKRAFTLIELLVVISIVSLLLAVLMPAMSRARQQGKTIVCLNNLRQMCIAAAAYTQTYDGYFPVAYYGEETTMGEIEYCWDFTAIDESDEIRIEPGILWQGQTIEKIHQCPSFKGDSNTQCDPYTGYNYNTSYIGHGQGENIPKPAKVNEVKKPANCALFGDGQWEKGANKFMRAPLRSPADRTFNGRYAGTQGYRHSDKTNVAWCDSHVVSWVQLYTNIEPVSQESSLRRYNEGNRHNRIGFLSPDNSLYDWQ